MSRLLKGGSYQPALIYCFSLLFIFGWWTLTINTNTQYLLLPQNHTKVDLTTFYSIDRQELIDALNGNRQAMLKLVYTWQEESERLNLPALTHEELQLFSNTKLSMPQKQRLFPQTYAAASILLAIAAQEEVIALPRGLKKLRQLLPTQKSDKIIIESDRFNTEALSLIKPTAAFTSPYSNPATIQALKEQAIPIHTLDAALTMSEMVETVKKIGRLSNHSPEAEQLSLFIKAALQALDNRVEWLQNHQKLPNFVVAYKTDQLKIPTTKTITGSILNRMGIKTPHSTQWSLPLTNEFLQLTKPDKIIIASEQKESEHIPLHVQMCPTQHMVVAYYDILYALAH